MPSPVVVVGGPETGRRNEFIAQLRKQCVREWRSEPEDHRLYAHETPVSTLLDLLLNGSLFSAGKFVQYLGADQVKAKADVQALVSYIRKPADSTVLVLVSDGLGVDKSIEEALPKDDRRVFWELSADELAGWVRGFFREASLTIDADAVDALLELVDNNTSALKSDCSHLALFFPAGSTIAADDIEQYVAHNRSEDSFSLFDRMATGNFEQSLETLGTILADRDGSGIGVLGGLLWSFRRLASLHAALAGGTPFEQAARSLRITRRATMATYNSARRLWPADVCRRLIAFGVETDARMRSMGQTREKVLLELYVYACVVARGPVMSLAQA